MSFTLPGHVRFDLTVHYGGNIFWEQMILILIIKVLRIWQIFYLKQVTREFSLMHIILEDISNETTSLDCFFSDESIGREYGLQ